MSGTSLDGVDVAIVDIHAKRGGIRIQPIAFRMVPYQKVVRQAILAVSNSMTHTATIARLHFALGEIYAAAVLETCSVHQVPLDSIALAGMHGQTIFHEGEAVDYLGHRVTSTLQIGESAIVAERTGLRTISNFRERDMAAGGKGAPLVPLADYLLFRHARIGRVALNIGGIANISVIPAAAKRDDVIAFDTGPGNMVMDALAAHHTQGVEHCDRDGRIASTGWIQERLLESMLSDPYFALDPPKTAGREQFGRDYANGLIATGLPLPDLIATATELTARSIAQAITRSVSKEGRFREVIASGGGVHNLHLMRRLRELLPEYKVMTSDVLEVDPDAKEAIAFAILAYEFVQHHPGNLPCATGARRAVLLGKSSPAC